MLSNPSARVVAAAKPARRVHTRRVTRARWTLLAGGAAAVAMLATACSPASPSTLAGSHSSAGSSTSATPAPPLRLTSVVPHKALGGTSTIRVKFSAPLAPTSVMPSIAPSVAGAWQAEGTSAVFTPTQAYAPYTAYTVTVPAGPQGVTGVDGGQLTAGSVVHLKGAVPSVTFAEQILARLRYLPLRTTAAAPQSAAAEAAAVYAPPHGAFVWRWNPPASLRAQWAPGQYTPVLQGAVLAFQHQVGLAPDGLLGPKTWTALLAADLAGQVSPRPYTYIYADLSIRPQTLVVWRDGSTVLTSPTNGGVPGALTPDGTFPIYERLTSTTMSGTNPDGTKYKDPGVPWVNYFRGGSAVHGFPRASYGFPQSVGCLELPIPTAKVVFGMVWYGTLVTVIGQ